MGKTYSNCPTLGNKKNFWTLLGESDVIIWRHQRSNFQIWSIYDHPRILKPPGIDSFNHFTPNTEVSPKNIKYLGHKFFCCRNFFLEYQKMMKYGQKIPVFWPVDPSPINSQKLFLDMLCSFLFSFWWYNLFGWPRMAHRSNHQFTASETPHGHPIGRIRNFFGWL